MTTATVKPPSWRPLFILCLVAAVVATYFLVTADVQLLSWPGVVAGAVVMFLVIEFLHGWRFFAAVVAAVVAVHVWGDASFRESWAFGLALTLLVIAALGLLAIALNTVGHTHTTSSTPTTGRRLVGLGGYAGSGKDTAARGLFWADDPYTRVSFADKLRDFCYAQNPLVVITADDPLFAEAGGTTETPVIYARVQSLVDRFGWERAKYEVDDVRQLLQRTGTDAGREVIGQDVWVDAVMSDLPEGNVVFTDTRFPNEAAAIKAAGGKVIRVSRPGVMPVNGHKSEYALDDWEFDGYLYNDADEHTAGKCLRDMVARCFEKTP